MFAGTPEPALPSLRALLASRHEVAAVLTRPPAPAGRGRTLRPSPVGELAAGQGLPVLTPRSPREPDFVEALRELAPACCAVVAYGALIPRPALDVPVAGWVNLHFSLLPAWRGAAPVQHAIRAGDEVTGATTFRLEEGMDTGPVYGVLTETIRPADTAGDLLERLATAGAELLVATLDGIEAGTLAAVPQPADGVSLAPKVTVEDARVDWGLPATAVDRLVRSCTPAPGAWSTLRGRRVKLGPVGLPGPPPPDSQPPDGQPPGRVWPDGTVGTGTTAVRLGDVQPEGRGAMDARDWLRGLRLQPGESFT